MPLLKLPRAPWKLPSRSTLGFSTQPARLDPVKLPLAMCRDLDYFGENRCLCVARPKVPMPWAQGRYCHCCHSDKFVARNWTCVPLAVLAIRWNPSSPRRLVRSVLRMSIFILHSYDGVSCPRPSCPALNSAHTRPMCHTCQDKESLLFKKGQAQERMKELSSLAQRQRLSLAEAEHRAKELEREASEAKKEARLAQEQVSRGLGVGGIPQDVNTSTYTTIEYQPRWDVGRVKCRILPGFSRAMP